ncbi:MAG: hypothetical protein KAT32_03560 [Candidatus Moranbacteria bacterium]|nr:hypothetical protein [Candidatus Moranbacteria bacterium]
MSMIIYKKETECCGDCNNCPNPCKERGRERGEVKTILANQDGDDD